MVFVARAGAEPSGLGARPEGGPLFMVAFPRRVAVQPGVDEGRGLGHAVANRRRVREHRLLR